MVKNIKILAKKRGVSLKLGRGVSGVFFLSCLSAMIYEYSKTAFK